MGGGASATAQEAQPRVQSSPKLVPGQAAIIRNSPNAHLNGEQVICEKYEANLHEWLVKGDRFPLTLGMELGAQFLEPQAGPTLLTSGRCSGKLVQGERGDLLRTILEEKCKAMFDCSKEKAGELVCDVHEHANRIIQQGSGTGASGDCPFASACEVDLYYQFCLKVFSKWSDYTLGEDERMDNEFFSQINDLCEILGFLDTGAVPLPQGTYKNIQQIQRQGFPNWVRGQIPHGEAAVKLCLVIGKKWQLEKTEAFQDALASLHAVA